MKSLKTDILSVDLSQELLPACTAPTCCLWILKLPPPLTEWAAQLKINPLYAILSGFEFGDTPGVGTFYDF